MSVVGFLTVRIQNAGQTFLELIPLQGFYAKHGTVLNIPGVRDLLAAVRTEK